MTFQKTKERCKNIDFSTKNVHTNIDFQKRKKLKMLTYQKRKETCENIDFSKDEPRFIEAFVPL